MALDDLASHMDVDQFALASFSKDHKEGVAAFLGRRKPQFRGSSARLRSARTKSRKQPMRSRLDPGSQHLCDPGTIAPVSAGFRQDSSWHAGQAHGRFA